MQLAGARGASSAVGPGPEGTWPSPAAPAFPAGLDAAFAFGPQGGQRGYFGRDVLAGLVSGIDDFLARARREPGFRSLSPAMIGAFMWLDDPELVERIAGFPYASVVITKQPRGRRQQARTDQLKPVLERCPGFPADALPELGGLVAREEGTAPVVGPYSPRTSPLLPPLRTVGFRKTGDRLIPILHTKMVLLGELWWHDEDEFGAAEVTGFRPQQLWLASANGTASSRANLEFGTWNTDPMLLAEATRFLTGLLCSSEDLDPDADDLQPDLADPDYDDAAFAEFLADQDDYRDAASEQ
jgi:hypothetical protein